MDDNLKTLLKKNYYQPDPKQTENFIKDFHQYRIKKQSERKTNFLAILLLAIVTVCGFSIILKETNNKLDIQTSSGEIRK
jgi:ABC-type uncharacterized transport system permease subunit